MDKQIAENEGAFVELLNQEMKELQESQKQIEEMVKDLVSEMLLPQYVEEVLKQPFSYFEEHYKDEIKSCFYLRKKGYRKIPEGAVVLTRDEFKAYSFVKEFFAGKSTKITAGELVRALQLYDKQARKETAEKIMNDISVDVLVVDTKEYGRIEVVPLERLDEICEELEGENG